MTGSNGDLVLRLLRPSDEAEALRAHEELRAEGFQFLLSPTPVDRFADLLDLLERQRLGIDVPPGRVPSTFLVAEVEGRIVGRTSIRHELNDRLRQEGGHVGYGVRPAFRRRGYATRMLELSLEYLAEDLGVTRALVTCDDDNVGSAAVIERCGGVLEDVVHPPWCLGPVRRYWIDLGA